MFSEFGLPSYRHGDPVGEAVSRRTRSWSSRTMRGPIYARALEGLRRAGCLGALLWCYSDYDPALWESPPFDLAPHERSFGLWRADGSPKPPVAAIAAFVGAARCTANADPWIDIDRDEFRRIRVALPRLYRRYRMSEPAGAGDPRWGFGATRPSPWRLPRSRCPSSQPSTTRAATPNKCWPCKSNPVRLGSFVSRALARWEIAGFRPGFWPQGQYRYPSPSGAQARLSPRPCGRIGWSSVAPRRSGGRRGRPGGRDAVGYD